MLAHKDSSMTMQKHARLFLVMI